MDAKPKQNKPKVQGGWAANSQTRGPPKPKPATNARPVTANQFGHLVVHVNKSPYDVYIGRPNPKIGTSDCRWGNPFKIPRDGDRAQVISKYKDWLTQTPDGQKILTQAKTELKGKVLACWCAPLPCHGNVLAELVNQTDEIIS